MAMVSEVIGFKPADEKWRKMKAVWDACRDAGVGLPPSVYEFFAGNDPDDAGVTVSMDALIECGAVWDYAAESESGFTVNLDKLPAGVTVLRFVTRY